MQARLKVLHDKANVKQVKLLPVTLIGRSTECNLKIASSQVSRNHCRITLGADMVFVEDLGSANGTLVDGQPIPPHQPTSIAPGARIIVGPAEFQIDYVASTSATVVLQRSGVPPVIELPLTEVITPPVAAALMPALAPVANPAAVTTEAPAAVPQPSPAVAIAAVAPLAVAATAPVAVEPPAPKVEPVVAVAAVIEQPIEETPSDPVLNTSHDTTLLEPGFDFNATEAVQDSSPDASEETVFMFQETIPESVPYENAAAPAEPVTKKAGLKSLFSIFGKKSKSTESAPQAAPAQPAAEPAVFLPAVEPVAEVLEEQSGAEETIEIGSDEDSQTSTDGDGFDQFLSQF